TGDVQSLSIDVSVERPRREGRHHLDVAGGEHRLLGVPAAAVVVVAVGEDREAARRDVATAARASRAGRPSGAVAGRSPIDAWLASRSRSAAGPGRAARAGSAARSRTAAGARGAGGAWRAACLTR